MATLSEPLKTFRFLVTVEYDPIEKEDSGVIVAAFSRFSGIKMHTDTVRIRSGSERRGVIDTVPALTSFENVTLEKGVIGDDDFLKWILAVAPNSIAPPTGTLATRTINIEALDDKGDSVITWSLISAMPVAYELDGMDGTRSEVLCESIEFEIKGFKREKHF